MLRVLTSIARGAKRTSLTSKQGNKNYYKGGFLLHQSNGCRSAPYLSSMPFQWQIHVLTLYQEKVQSPLVFTRRKVCKKMFFSSMLINCRKLYSWPLQDCEHHCSQFAGIWCKFSTASSFLEISFACSRARLFLHICFSYWVVFSPVDVDIISMSIVNEAPTHMNISHSLAHTHTLSL